MSKLLKNVDVSKYTVEPKEKSEAVISIPVDEIRDMPGNEYLFPYDETVINQIMSEIKENGFQSPIIVTKDETGYLCISGHQRKLAMQRLGETKIPCIVRKDLTEKGIRDLWRAENTMHRKSTPISRARLAQSYAEDYDKYELKGGKRKYIAEKCGVSETQADNLLLLLKFPESIQKRCEDPDFPYSALVAAKKFDANQMDMLVILLNQFSQKYPNVMMTNAELKKMIKKVEEDSKEQEYDDIDPLEGYDKTNDEELKKMAEQRKASYKQYYHDNFFKNHDNIVLNDLDLQKATDSVYRLLNQGEFVAQNRMNIEKSLYGLEEAVSMIKKYLKS